MAPTSSGDPAEPAAVPVKSVGTASDGALATPDPERPVPVSALATASAWSYIGSLVLGFGILVACLLAGEWLKGALGLILPGNILGLFILLALMATGIVPLCGVELAGRWLLFLLPLLFVPVFVVALRKALHLPQGVGFFGAVFCGVFLLWACVGHLAQRLMPRQPDPEQERKKTSA